MKATELRIGNKVIELGGVVTVGKNTFKLWDELNLNLVLKPIPLTEEWWDKIDKTFWVNYKYGSRKIIQHIKFRSIKLELTGSNQVAVYFNEELINIKDYFHQLQNLYHALTGIELTLQQ